MCIIGDEKAITHYVSALAFSDAFPAAAATVPRTERFDEKVADELSQFLLRFLRSCGRSRKGSPSQGLTNRIECLASGGGDRLAYGLSLFIKARTHLETPSAGCFHGVKVLPRCISGCSAIIMPTVTLSSINQPCAPRPSKGDVSFVCWSGTLLREGGSSQLPPGQCLTRGERHSCQCTCGGDLCT